MDQKRLYKARGHRMVCGVCGGIAEYFGVDPTIVRLAFVLLWRWRNVLDSLEVRS